MHGSLSTQDIEQGPPILGHSGLHRKIVCRAFLVGKVTTAPSCAPQSSLSLSPVHVGRIYQCTSQGSHDSHIMVLSMEPHHHHLQTLHTLTCTNSHSIYLV